MMRAHGADEGELDTWEGGVRFLPGAKELGDGLGGRGQMSSRSDRRPAPGPGLDRLTLIRDPLLHREPLEETRMNALEQRWIVKGRWGVRQARLELDFGLDVG